VIRREDPNNLLMDEDCKFLMLPELDTSRLKLTISNRSNKSRWVCIKPAALGGRIGQVIDYGETRQMTMNVMPTWRLVAWPEMDSMIAIL
jgi:hypothetical protein